MLQYANPVVSSITLSVSYTVVAAINGETIRLVMSDSCFLGRSNEPAIDFTFTVAGSPTAAVLASAIVAALNSLNHLNLVAAVTGVSTIFCVHGYDLVSGGATPYLSGTALSTGHITPGPVHSFYVPNRSMIREKAGWDVVYDQAVAKGDAASAEAAALRSELIHVQGLLAAALVDGGGAETPAPVAQSTSSADFSKGFAAGLTASLLTKAMFGDGSPRQPAQCDVAVSEPFWRT